MRAVFGLVLIVGMGLAGVAVYMIQGYIAQLENALQVQRDFNGQAGKLVEAYVFNKELNYGDALTPDDVQLVFLPEQALPETIFRDPALLFPENAPGPRYIMRDTEVFEPVLASRVTEPGELAGLTARLEPGMRAFQIRVGVASGVADFVQPDSFIDVYWTGTPPGANGSVTQLIQSSMQVIAVDDAFNASRTSSSGGGASTITVAASPTQVALLTQAQATGSLTMSLVGEGAQEVSEAIEFDTRAMLGLEEEVVVVEEAPVVEEVCTRRERKGTEIIDTVVPCEN
jgi:pilus assembly protein CpaB